MWKGARDTTGSTLHILVLKDPADCKTFKEMNLQHVMLQDLSGWVLTLNRCVPTHESRHCRTCADPSWDLVRWSQRWLHLCYEWAKLLWSRCLWRAPFSRRGEPKLNKYLLHPVCIKGLHTWLWRQSDIKQGGVAQPALTGTYTLSLFHSLLLNPCLSLLVSIFAYFLHFFFLLLSTSRGISLPHIFNTH